jgi:ferredoxin-NADP reductase
LENNGDFNPSNNPGANQTVELVQRRWLTQNVFEIELTRPSPLEFKAGQTIRFIHDSMIRYYSLLSKPDAPTLAICVHLVPRGSFSPILANAPVNTRFNISGPHGYFIYHSSQRPPVFIATGTGIAPFVSMGRSGVADFTLLHEVQSTEDLLYQDLFRETASRFVPCLLEPSAAEPLPPHAYHGSAADYLRKNLPAANYDFYLCGNREMIREVTLLADERFSESYVFKEVFF